MHCAVRFLLEDHPRFKGNTAYFVKKENILRALAWIPVRERHYLFFLAYILTFGNDISIDEWEEELDAAFHYLEEADPYKFKIYLKRLFKQETTLENKNNAYILLNNNTSLNYINYYTPTTATTRIYLDNNPSADTWFTASTSTTAVTTTINTILSSNTITTGFFPQYQSYNLPIIQTTSWQQNFKQILVAALENYQKFQNRSFYSKNDRKVLQRQILLLENFLPYQDLRMFMSGDVIKIKSDYTGLTYAFKLQKRFNVKDALKGKYYAAPYHISLFKDDEYIASLCTYIKDTPLFDQLSAMLLYIQSGEEKHMLEHSNFIRVKNKKVLEDYIEKLKLKHDKKFIIESKDLSLSFLEQQPLHITSDRLDLRLRHSVKKTPLIKVLQSFVG